MKMFYIILIMLLLVEDASAQTCLPYGIIFNSQTGIDNFQIDYPGCKEILGDLSISYNVNNLNGLNVLTRVDGDVAVFYTNLKNFTGLNRLNMVGGDFEIWGNDSLISCSGLDALTKVSGNFSIGTTVYNENGNSMLNSLSGLESLTTIEGWLLISLNDSLKNIEGLKGLTTLKGSLGIFINASLTSLKGIDNIDAGSVDNLTISSNPMLSYCSVKSVCNYIAAPSGIIIISGNATGCNSQAEADTACRHLSVDDFTSNGNFLMYPNPASSSITIETTTKGSLSVINSSGQRLLQADITSPVTTIDVSTLPGGVYFVRVTGERTVETGKFIKQ